MAKLRKGEFIERIRNRYGDEVAELTEKYMGWKKYRSMPLKAMTRALNEVWKKCDGDKYEPAGRYCCGSLVNKV